MTEETGRAASGCLTSALAAAEFLLPLGRAGATPLTRTSLWWLVPIGLLVGVCWTGLFRASWRIFGEVASLRLMPALVILVADVAVFGRRLHAGAARTVLVSRRRLHGDGGIGMTADHVRTLAVFLSTLVLVEFVLLASLPTGPEYWPSDWRRFVVWAYPGVIYRPLVLAPTWGCWGVLLAFGVGRSHPSADAEIAGLCRAWRPLPALVTFVLLGALTTVYCARHGNVAVGTIISLGVFALSFVTAVVLSRRQGGHTRDSVLAVGLAAQLAFLVVYVGFSQVLTRW